ncbi:helix-turn-helix domain-containing protein [Leifsonia sp. C5G2]|uniref:helix-turn-helix domain-containing protein n=1 Tax=Leifsonia sp. C5G2 TaxID=2735269 RepID=UPI0015854FBB|nr:helix-turn-helix domain-containing protein [Leifsonia sp. C5G2]NUU05191.1 hypothetical protein [Leifsonia sp. C5G2]
MASALTQKGTASESIPAPVLTETRLTAARLTEEVGGNRSEARVLNQDYQDLHQRTHDVEWRTAAATRAKSSVATMLGELADLGFAWRDIARLLGVSVPAVQKWRKGERASGESRQKLANLLAACDLIAGHYMVDEIASWFEMPITMSAPLTPIDFYARERADLVFEYASGHTDPESLLSQFEPDWREHYRSEFEVFEAGDGNRSIRMKG